MYSNAKKSDANKFTTNQSQLNQAVSVYVSLVALQISKANYDFLPVHICVYVSFKCANLKFRTPVDGAQGLKTKMHAQNMFICRCFAKTVYL